MSSTNDRTLVLDATTHAVALLEKFSNCDVDDLNSPWSNPDEIFAQLDEARRNVINAWKSTAIVDESKELDDAAFRMLYLEMVTDAFSTVLENLRHENQNVDVNILVDCLESGMEFLTSEEREFFADDEMDAEIEESSTSVSERKIHELGLTQSAVQ